MTASDIFYIISSLTTVTAIVTPAITTIYTAKSQERVKKAEMYSPRVYDALSDMAKAYSLLMRGEKLPEAESDRQPFYDQAINAYYNFSGTAYTVMALISDKNIQSKITNLITEIQEFSYFPNVLHDKLFCDLMNDITNYLRKLRK